MKKIIVAMGKVREWCEMHINLTVLISLVLLGFLATVVQLIMLLIVPIEIAILAWALKRKGRSYWWIVFGPFGLFLLENERVDKESVK